MEIKQQLRLSQQLVMTPQLQQAIRLLQLSRLELVEDSATTDRPGHLDVEPNGEGSYVLTFVIDEPLPGKTGGVVTFKARVR